MFFLFLFFLAVLGIEFRASTAAGRCSTIWAPLWALFCSYFWDRVSLYAWAGLNHYYLICASPCSWYDRCASPWTAILRWDLVNIFLG
jgi:hypothetical protein